MNEELPQIPPASETEKTRIPVLQQLGVSAGILALMFGTTYIPELTSSSTKEEAPASVITIDEPKIAPVEVGATFEELSLQARAVYVWDVAGQRALFNKNADTQLPLASVTKLMTALVAYELLGEDAEVQIDMNAINEEGESGLLNGEKFSIRNLLDLTLITSSNDGAAALASAAGAEALGDSSNGRAVFIDAMNLRAEEIGLTNTIFKNPTGLDISTTETGGYGSARDVAFLMEYIITHYPEMLERTKDDFLLIPNTFGATHEAENTNTAVTDITGLIASKTGYTDLSGGNLVIAFDAGLNRPVIISVLGSTQEGRFTDTLRLVKAVKTALQSGE